MRAAILLVLLLAAAPAAAVEYATVGGYPACLTEENYVEAARALAAGDQELFRAIRGCVITKPDIELQLLERGAEVAKIRIYTPEGRSVRLWTSNDNVKER